MIKNQIRSLLQRVGRTMHQSMYQSQLEQLTTLQQHAINTRAKQILQPLQPKAFVPESDWSLDSRIVLVLANDICVNRRQQVVEFGSGVSTFYLGKLLQQQGGKLYSFESDARWYHLYKEILHAENLEDTVRLTHAPMALYTEAIIEKKQWYDKDLVRDVVCDIEIDMIIVDGPIGCGIRYPAIPVLSSYLAESYTILLDDAQRPMGREVLTAWEKLLGVKFHHFPGFSMAVKDGVLPSVIL